MTVDPSLVEAKPCAELWFDDGSVILRSRPLMFRVYRGILSAHSEVFRDMFTVPQPEYAEKFDDIPVVDLPDNPEDLTYFLRAMHDIGFYDENMKALHKIAGILRLSTKYIVEGLRIRAVKQLLTAYPATYEEFVHLENFPNTSRVETFDGMEIAVVNLGEELDIPQLLPSAYYKLVGQRDDRFLSDGAMNPQTHNSALETLCRIALLRCLKGRDAMRQALTREICGFILNVCPYRNGICHPGRMIAWRAIEDGLTAKTLGPFHGSRVDVSRLCEQCQAHFTGVYPRLLRQAWERLPDWFNLSSWENLLKQD